MFYKIISITLLLFSISLSASDKPEVQKAIQALSGSNTKNKIKAIQFLGEESKSKQAVPHLIQLLNSSKDPAVLSASISALGYIQESKNSVPALKNFVLSSKNTDLVYAALFSLISISIQEKQIHPDTKEAFNFADKNHRSDEYIADILDRIKKELPQYFLN